MKTVFVYLIFCFFSVLPFLIFWGLILLFLNKSKYAKNYIGYFVKRNFGLFRVKSNDFCKEKINNLVLLLLRVYNFLFIVILGLILFFLILGGISILIYFK